MGDKTLGEWFVRPPGRRPYGPILGEVIVEGVLCGGIARGSEVCAVGATTWVPLAEVPAFRAVKNASVTTLRPVELGAEDESPTPVRLASPFPPVPAASAGRLPPLPTLRTPRPPLPSGLQPELASPDRPSFAFAAVASAIVGGILGAAAWLVHDGSREAPTVSQVAVEETRAPQVAAPPPATPRPVSRPAAAVDPEPAPVAAPDHPLCRLPNGDDSGICGWLVEVANGSSVTMPLADLQRTLKRKGVFEAELSLLGEPDAEGRLPVAFHGDPGFCFVPARTVKRSDRIVAWVERRPGAIRAFDRKCQALVEVGSVRGLVELTAIDDGEKARELARRILSDLSQAAPKP